MTEGGNEEKLRVNKRGITWADGTAEPNKSHLAISITRHKNLVKYSFSFFLSFLSIFLIF